MSTVLGDTKRGKKWLVQKTGIREITISSLVEDCACHSCQASNQRPIPQVSPTTFEKSKTAGLGTRRGSLVLRALLIALVIYLRFINPLIKKLPFKAATKALLLLKNYLIPYQLEFNFKLLTKSSFASGASSAKRSCLPKIRRVVAVKNPQSILSILQ